ncbi:MAG: hypothetical protein GEU26_07405 [Nitrososphaeraceae archaeon]|nr:hypothetical protein [Nitrososphaeraceae archaeon]
MNAHDGNGIELSINESGRIVGSDFLAPLSDIWNVGRPPLGAPKEGRCSQLLNETIRKNNN